MTSAAALQRIVARALTTRAATPPRPPPQPEQRNALLYPFGPLPPAPSPTWLESIPLLKNGALTYNQGGIEGARTRAFAYLGLGCTIRGLAWALAHRFPEVPTGDGGTVKRTNPDQLARAILYYNREVILGLEQRAFDPVTQAQVRSNWLVGRRLPLPIEQQPDTLPPEEWITSLDDIEAWERLYWEDPSNPILEWLLELPVAELPVPDPAELARKVESGRWIEVPGRSPAAEIHARLLRNPFEPVFEIVQVLRQIENSRELAIQVALLLTESQARSLGYCTGGNAVLRQLWRVFALVHPVVDETLQKAMQTVAHGLGINASAGYPDPWAVGPDVEPKEMPLMPRQQRIRTPRSFRARPGEEHPYGARVMVLGRNLCVSTSAKPYRDDSGRVYEGYSNSGRLDPSAYYSDTNRSRVTTPYTPATFPERIELAIKISHIEGKLDACRAMDKALLSTGMQQWSIHVNTEMTVLLQRLRDRAEDHFDLFFGMYGLQTSVSAKKAAPTSADIRSANPHYHYGETTTPDGRAILPEERYPLYVALKRVRRNQPGVELGEESNERGEFFGAARNGSGGLDFSPVAGAWCGRVRLAALCSPDYNIVQLQTAAYRFTRIARQLEIPRVGRHGVERAEPFRVTIDGVEHTAQELFSSELGAAAVLDHHINTPFNIEGSISAACTRSTTTPPPHAPTPEGDPPSTTLTDAYLRRFVVNYIAGRVLSNSIKADRDARVLWLHDDELRTAPGTFTGW